MIYPASYDITILQNATWSASLRATNERQALSSAVVTSGTVIFSKDCHDLEAGDKVVFTTASGAMVPCGFQLNEVYFVIASGLTDNSFYVAATSGGTAIAVSDTASGQYYVAKPVHLSGYTVDSDITTLIDYTPVATFACIITDAANGKISISMPPSTSVGMDAARYHYDVSLTSPSGDRYYWLTGIATVQRTYSRN